VRGRDKDIGKENLMETWDGWIRPCDEPLGTDMPVQEASERGIPF
jgi:hypothetical protein